MERTAALLLSLIVTLGALAPGAARADGNDEVEVLRAGDKVMYKYVDDDGQVVIQDHPPAKYFDVEAAEPAADVPAAPAPEPAAPAPAPEASSPPWLRPLWSLAAGALAAAGAAVLVLPWLRERRGESALQRTLRRAGMPAFHQLAVNDGARRHALVDCLVRTPAGFLVLGVERFSGTVRGTPEQADWQVAGSADTRDVANPLLRVQRVADVVQALVPDVPVHARVVYSGRARFANGTPAALQRLSDLRGNLAHYTRGEVGARALDAGWRTLMRFPHANRTAHRVTGGGWRRWLRRHGRTAGAAILLALASVSAAVALTLDGS